MTTQAEQETIEAFCRELALALRRITGRDVKIKPGDLPVCIPELEEGVPDMGGNPEESQEMDEKK